MGNDIAAYLGLLGNVVIAVAYAAITIAIAAPLIRAGGVRSNRLATGTALIFFSCAIGHGFHAADWTGHTHDTGWSLWSPAIWDVLTGAVAVYYWTMRRSYGALLGTLFVDSEQQQRLDALALEERVAAGRAAAEAERDAQARMLRDVITNSQSVICVKDLEGRYLMVNGAFEEATGLRAADLLGMTDDVVDPKMAPVWRANDLRGREGTFRVREFSNHHAGGPRVYDSVKFPLYDAHHNLYAVCAVSTDVTALQASVSSAERGRDDAVALSNAKSLFMATLSHEIRTPANGVIGLTTLLLGTSLDSAQRRYAEGLSTSGRALLAVVNDALDFAKLEAGKLVLDDTDLAPAAVLADTVSVLGQAAEAKGLSLVTVLDPQLPPAVRGDAGRLRQVLVNLTGNAIKFTPQGSVTIRAGLDTSPVGDSDAPDATSIRFEVTDTGIGVAAADAERLFEPYVQANVTTRSGPGTGLGLAISRRLVEAMGGTIGVHSEVDRGSTFWCTVPLRAAHGPVDPPAAVLQKDAKAAAEHRILLVEDNEINQIVAEGLLAGLGYTTDLAGNGREALELLARNTYELVLMDCHMPLMDGYETTIEIRRREADPASDGVGGAGSNRHIPVIAMTAATMSEDRERCQAAGMDDFVSKPIVPELLAATMSRWADEALTNRA